jgi:biopolymer transport protein ExbD
MKKKASETLEVPVSSMIDITFLLIIFFVVTAAVEKEIVDESIQLAHAKYVKGNDKKDPRTVTINVAPSGDINIGLQPLTLTQLKNVLIASRATLGNSVPILIRSDRSTRYREIDKVIEKVGEAGLYRIQLSAQVDN